MEGAVNSVNTDERTSSHAQLTVGDETTTRKPRKLLLIIIVAVVCCLIIAGAVTAVVVVLTSTPEPLCVTKQCNESAASILSNMDKTKKPCNNFFEYACGGWNERQVIPGDKLEVSRFSELDDDLQGKLKELTGREPQPNEPKSFSKVRQFYNACLDLDTINGLGAGPLTETLQALGGWPVLGSNPGGNWSQLAYNFESLWATLASQYNIQSIISTGVGINVEDSQTYILMISIPEFTVPLQFRERRRDELSSLIPESFSKDFGRHMLLLDGLEDKREAYLQYMIDIAVALGANQSEATTDMNDVLDFEKTLAQYADTAKNDDSDLPETHDLSYLSIFYDQIDWASLYSHLLPSSVDPPVSSYEDILSRSPYYLDNVNTILLLKQPRVVANYMLWRLVNKMVPYLGEEYLAIHQTYQKAILGLSSATDRWKRCTHQVNTVLPFATGRMYVDEYFTDDTKTKTEEMVGQLRSALRVMMGTVDWLEPSDLKKARQKLDVMGVSVGYPDWLMVNTTLDAKSVDLVVTSNSYFTNVVNYARRAAQTQLRRLRLTVDRALWGYMGPAVINAYYSPLANGIVIPAGILQPPFYHADMPWSSNFGGVGAVLGHEITHGFDSRGRFYDQNGIISESWWGYSSIIGFQSAAQCLVNQYSNFVMPENQMNVDGQLTEAENIADNGGVREAYKAYKTKAPSDHKLPGLEDLTDYQLLFLSYSQVWCSVMTPEWADHMIKYGVHSPGRFRVLGPLQNNEFFSEAFGCKSGDTMYKSESTRCKVWY